MKEKTENVKQNSAAPYTFAEGGKWDAELAWYPPSDTHQIYFYSLEHGFGIDSFRPVWYCLNVESCIDRMKFLESSGYFTVINRAFIFLTINIFTFFHVVMV